MPHAADDCPSLQRNTNLRLQIARPPMRTQSCAPLAPMLLERHRHSEVLPDLDLPHHAGSDSGSALTDPGEPEPFGFVSSEVESGGVSVGAWEIGRAHV